MNNPPQLIMLGPHLDGRGGVSSVVKEYLKCGLSNKYKLTLIATQKEGSKLKKAWVFFCSIFILLKLLLFSKRVIVHIHLSQNGSFFRKFILFLIVKIFRKKTVIHLHGSVFENFMNEKKLNKFLCTCIFNKPNHVIVLSKLWKKKIEAIAPKQNISVLYNPIALMDIDKLDSLSLRILFLGRLCEQKGTYDLLNCIEQNKEIFRNLKLSFVMAGNGDVEQARSYVSHHQISDLVEVPGWVDGADRINYLRSSAVMILPSYNEQMPMSILEGMSYGLPIIASNVAGIPEMLEHDLNGFLITAGDIQSMGKHIIEIASKPDLRKRMGEKSRSIVSEKFESHKIIDQLFKIYGSLYA